MKALHRAGKKSTIKDSLKVSGKEELDIDYEYSTIWDRDSEFVASLGMTSKEIDQLFIDASKI